MLRQRRSTRGYRPTPRWGFPIRKTKAFHGLLGWREMLESGLIWLSTGSAMLRQRRSTRGYRPAPLRGEAAA